MGILTCVLYGRTTTKDQFLRLIESLKKQSFKDVAYIFYCHEEVPELDELMRDDRGRITFEVVLKDGDPGHLRNHFLDEYISKVGQSYFSFLDGDDEIEPTYFEKLYSHADLVDADVVVGNPILYYDEDRQFPSMWWDGIQRDFVDLYKRAISDKVGGQAWGKLYSVEFFRWYPSIRFGTGMFEDVPFWVECALNSTNIIYCDAKYIWHRDNPMAITRNVNTRESVENGLKNLIRTLEIVKANPPAGMKELFTQRYTWAFITVCRNIFNHLPGQWIKLMEEFHDIILSEYIDFSIVDKESQGWKLMIDAAKNESRQDLEDFIARHIG